MPEIMPFIIFGVVFIIIVAVLFLKSRAGSKARTKRFQAMGFTPMKEDSELVETITRMENNTEYGYSVKDPMKAAVKGKDIYFYEKSRYRTGHIYATEEFLFPLTRKSGQGLMLFVKPGNIPAGTATKLIGALATGAWDAQPDDLQKLEIPPDLTDTNLIGAMGPAGTSLDDLMERRTLNRMLHAGDFNAFIILCRDGLCSFSSPQPRMPLDMERAYAFICELL